MIYPELIAKFSGVLHVFFLSRFLLPLLFHSFWIDHLFFGIQYRHTRIGLTQYWYDQCVSQRGFVARCIDPIL